MHLCVSGMTDADAVDGETGKRVNQVSIFQFRYEPEAGLSRYPLLLDLTGLKLEV